MDGAKELLAVGEIEGCERKNVIDFPEFSVVTPGHVSVELGAGRRDCSCRLAPPREGFKSVPVAAAT